MNILGGMPHIGVGDCVLVIIDAQPGFYGPGRSDVDRGQLASALDSAAWCCGLAVALGVPVVVTEEDTATNGRTIAAVRDVLGATFPMLPKVVFDASDNPAIDAALRATARSTVILVGLETDVCITHSAMGWRESGLRVAVISDAVYSGGEGHAFGLGRLAREGIELLSAKELYYEWLRDLPSVRSFDIAHPGLAFPPGFSL
jgi:nicotinamidase-related amidase